MFETQDEEHTQILQLFDDAPNMQENLKSIGELQEETKEETKQDLT